VPDTPTLMRLRRPRWKDPRLLVGVLLVLLSIVLGAGVVSRMAATTTVLVARGDVVIGDPLDVDAFTTAEVRLGERTGQYADGPGRIPQGATAQRTVAAGELLPLSAIGQGGQADLRPVVIPVDRSVAESVATGRTVELWHTADPGSGAAAGGTGASETVAELLVPDAVVHGVQDGSSLGMRSVGVEVLVPQDRLAGVLEAIARDDRLDVIGVPSAQEVDG
jgi:hypothetical protein